MRRLLAAALVALTLGCGSDTLGPVMTVDGQWSEVQSGYSLSLSMTQSSTGDVTGTALLAGNSGVADATIAGKFVYPSLVLTVTSESFLPFEYAGVMSATEARINGKLNGSGFNNVEIDVKKRR